MSCCTYSVFMDDYYYYWPRYFDKAPTDVQLKRARSDWRANSTGYEAVRIAKQLADEAQAKALEKPLVHLGGRHFA